MNHILGAEQNKSSSIPRSIITYQEEFLSQLAGILVVIDYQEEFLSQLAGILVVIDN
jgi:hypothetical protein